MNFDINRNELQLIQAALDFLAKDYPEHSSTYFYGSIRDLQAKLKRQQKTWDTVVMRAKKAAKAKVRTVKNMKITSAAPKAKTR